MHALQCAHTVCSSTAMSALYAEHCALCSNAVAGAITSSSGTTSSSSRASYSVIASAVTHSALLLPIPVHVALLTQHCCHQRAACCAFAAAAVAVAVVLAVSLTLWTDSSTSGCSSVLS
jgi:hypothetical protein